MKSAAKKNKNNQKRGECLFDALPREAIFVLGNRFHPDRFVAYCQHSVVGTWIFLKFKHRILEATLARWFSRSIGANEWQGDNSKKN